MVKQNQWHLAHIPTLTYIAQFNFMTPLSLDQCSQKLIEATKEDQLRGKTRVCEVSHDHDDTVVFGAKYAMNQSA
jgi:hypothetical protein